MSNEESKSDVVKEARELLAKATAGPWFAAFDRAEECGPHKNSGLALVDTGRESDWPIARLCEWHNARLIAKLPELLAALCGEVEQLRRRNATQEESITHLQQQVRELNDQIAKTSWQDDDHLI